MDGTKDFINKVLGQSASKKEAYTQDELEDSLRQAGWEERYIPTMSAIGMAESTLTPDGRAKVNSFNPGVGAGGKKTIEKSYGNWQINMHPSLRRPYDIKKLTSNPTYNAEVALELFKERQSTGKNGLTHWGAYTDGRYKKFLRSSANNPAKGFVDQVLTDNATEQAPQFVDKVLNPMSSAAPINADGKPYLLPGSVGGTQLPPVNPTGVPLKTNATVLPEAAEQVVAEQPIDAQPQQPSVLQDRPQPYTVPPTPQITPKQRRVSKGTPKPLQQAPERRYEAGEPVITDVPEETPKTNFKRRLLFRDKPKEVSNRDWLVENLIPELVTELGVDAQDAEVALRDGIQHRKGTPLDEVRADQYYEFVMTPEFMERLTTTRDNRLRTEELYKQKDAKRDEYLKGWSKDQSPVSADIQASMDVGLLDKEKGQKLLDEENTAYQDWLKANPQSGQGADLDLTNIGQARLGAEVPVGKPLDIERYKQTRQANLDKAIKDTLAKNGSFVKANKAQKEFKERFKDAPMSYIFEQGKTAVGAAMKAPLQSAGAILQTIAIGSEAVERATGGLPGDPNDPAAEQKALYKLGQDFIDLAEGLKIDKDFKGGNAEIAGQVVGQVISQIGAGILTGGVAIPTLMGVSQGAVDRYKTSKEEVPDIGVWERLGAAAVGGLIEAPDYIMFKGLMKGGSTLAKASFLQNLRDVIEKRLIRSGASAQVAERAAISVADGAASRMLGASGYEAIQEGTTSPLNDLAAYIMYDPSPERWAKATTPTSEMFVEAAAGFFGGLIGASMTEVSQRANELTTDEATKIEAQLNEVAPLLPKESVELIREALGRRIKMGDKITPISEMKVSPKAKTETQTTKDVTSETQRDNSGNFEPPVKEEKPQLPKAELEAEIRKSSEEAQKEIEAEREVEKVKVEPKPVPTIQDEPKVEPKKTIAKKPLTEIKPQGKKTYWKVEFPTKEAKADTPKLLTDEEKASLTYSDGTRTGTLETMPNGAQRIRLRPAKVGNPMDGTTAMSARWKPTSEPMESAKGSVKTDTPEFKRFFGKSKVVNETGTPIVMAHGTTAETDFDTFKRNPSDIGIHVGTKGQANDRLSFLNRGKEGVPQRNIPVYIRAENPLRLPDVGWFDWHNLPDALEDAGLDARRLKGYDNYAYDVQRDYNEANDIEDEDNYDFEKSDEYRDLQNNFAKEARRIIQDAGYDSVVYRNTGEVAGAENVRVDYKDREKLGDAEFNRRKALEDQYTKDNAEDSYILFEPTQIKSAIGNKGTYDPNNPSIMERTKEEMEASKESFEAAKKLPINELLTIADPKKLTHSDGIVDMNDVAEFELVRRVMGNAFGKTGMSAVFQEPASVQKFIETARGLATQANEAGVDGTKFTELANIVEDATKANGTAIFYIDESDLGEEKAHRSLYMLRQGERATQVPKSDLDTFVAEPIVQKALSGRFGKLYKNKSKPAQMEEFAVKASRGQWNDLDITDTKDKRAAAQVAINYLAKFAETNAKEGQTKDEVLRQLARELVYGQEAQEIERELQGKGATDVQSAKDSDKQAPDGEKDRPVSGERKEAKSESKTSDVKERKTVTSAHSFGLINKSELPEGVRNYTTKSKIGNQREAQDYIDRVGFETAYNEALLMATEGDLRRHGSLQMAVIQLLDQQAKQAANEGETDLFKYYEEQQKAVFAALAEQGTDAGQFISQLSEWNITNPHTVVNFAKMKRQQMGLTPSLDADIQAELERLATVVADAQATIATQQAKLNDIETGKERYQSEGKTTKPLTTLEKQVLDMARASSKDALERLRHNPAFQNLVIPELMESARDTELDSDTLDDLKSIGAVLLLEGWRGNPMTVEQFGQKFHDLFSGGFDPFIDQLHAESVKRMESLIETAKMSRDVDLLKAKHPEMSDAQLWELAKENRGTKKAENAQKQKVRNEHRKIADAYFDRDARLERDIAKEQERQARLEQAEIEKAWKERERQLSQEERANARELEKEFRQAEQARKKDERKERTRQRQEAVRESEKYTRVMEFIDAMGEIDPNASPEVMAAAVLQKFDNVDSIGGLTQALRQRFPDTFAPQVSDTTAQRTLKQEAVTMTIAKSRLLFQKANRAVVEANRVKRNAKLSDVDKQMLADAKTARREGMADLDAAMRTAISRPPSIASQIAIVSRASKTALVQTAMTNVVSTKIEQNAYNRVVDTMDILLQRVFKDLKNEGISGATSLATTWWTPRKVAVSNEIGELKLSKHDVLIRILDEHPHFFAKFFGDFSPDYHTGLKKTLDKLMIPMRIQEFFMRDSEAIKTLAQRVSARGLDFNQIVKNGDYDVFTEADIEYALKRALTLTSAMRAGQQKDGITDKVFGGVVSAMHSSGFLDLLGSQTTPFLNFMYNTVNKYKQVIPVMAQARLTGKTASLAKRLKEQGEPDYIVQAVKENWTSRQLANQMWGVAALGIMMMAVRALGDKDEWYVFRIPLSEKWTPSGEPLYLDIRTQPMLAPLAFIANKTNRALNGKNLFTYGNPAEEIAEAFLGTSYRQAVEWNSLFNAAKHLGMGTWDSAVGTGQDSNRDWEKFWYFTKKWGGNEIATLTNFLQFKTIKDIVAQFDTYEQTPLNLDDAPFFDSIDRRLPESRRILEQLYNFETQKNYATDKDKQSPSPFPILKVLGFNLRRGDTLKDIPSQEEMLAAQLRWGNSAYERPVLADEKKVDAIKRDFRKEGEAVAKRQAETGNLVETGLTPEGLDLAAKLKTFSELTEGQQKYALQNLWTSDLEDNFASLSAKTDKRQKVSNAEQVYRIASPENKAKLADEYAKKLNNILNDKDVTESDAKKAEALLKEFSFVRTPSKAILKQKEFKSLPDKLESTFTELGIKMPGFGDSLTPKDGAKTKLTPEQAEQYKRETIERIEKKVDSLMMNKAYKDADNTLRKKMIEGIIRKQRAEEAKEMKEEMLKTPKKLVSRSVADPEPGTAEWFGADAQYQDASPPEFGAKMMAGRQSENVIDLRKGSTLYPVYQAVEKGEYAKAERLAKEIDTARLTVAEREELKKMAAKATRYNLPDNWLTLKRPAYKTAR